MFIAVLFIVLGFIDVRLNPKVMYILAGHRRAWMLKGLILWAMESHLPVLNMAAATGHLPAWGFCASSWSLMDENPQLCFQVYWA